jgi:hypothetical protein
MSPNFNTKNAAAEIAEKKYCKLLEYLNDVFYELTSAEFAALFALSDNED